MNTLLFIVLFTCSFNDRLVKREEMRNISVPRLIIIHSETVGDSKAINIKHRLAVIETQKVLLQLHGNCLQLSKNLLRFQNGSKKDENNTSALLDLVGKRSLSASRNIRR